MCPGGWWRALVIEYARDQVRSSRGAGGGSSAWTIEVFVFNLEVCHISNLLIVFQISVGYEGKR